MKVQLIQQEKPGILAKQYDHQPTEDSDREELVEIIIRSINTPVTNELNSKITNQN
jgi:hypothetical protein